MKPQPMSAPQNSPASGIWDLLTRMKCRASIELRSSILLEEDSDFLEVLPSSLELAEADFMPINVSYA